jgi:hypothetical protein
VPLDSQFYFNPVLPPFSLILEFSYLLFSEFHQLVSIETGQASYCFSTVTLLERHKNYSFFSWGFFSLILYLVNLSLILYRALFYLFSFLLHQLVGLFLW